MKCELRGRAKEGWRGGYFARPPKEMAHPKRFELLTLRFVV